MYTPTMDEIKKLREMTGAGISDCKAALQETSGDLEKAVEVLRKKGIMKASKKMDRATSQGVIASYIHTGGQIGSLIEINCETDFVSRNEEFQKLAQELAIHVVAYNPLAISPEDLDPALVEKEKEIIKEQLRNEGKSEAMIEKIVEGKIQKFYDEVCLLRQPFYKDEKKTVEEYIKEHIAKFGENIRVNRFVRFQVGT